MGMSRSTLGASCTTQQRIRFWALVSWSSGKVWSYKGCRGSTTVTVSGRVMSLPSGAYRWLWFPNAAGSANQHIAFLADVVTTGEVQDLLAVDARIETEVEPFQRLGGVDCCPPHPQRQLFLGPPLDLILQQSLQKLDIRPLAVNRLTVAGLQRRQNAREPQLLERGNEADGSGPCPTSKQMPQHLAGAADTRPCWCGRCGRWRLRLVEFLVQDALDGRIARLLAAQRAFTCAFEALVAIGLT